MIRGFRYVTHAWVSAGHYGPIPPEQLKIVLEQRLQGELFENCSLTVEGFDGEEIKLDRIEGILVLPDHPS